MSVAADRVVTPGAWAGRSLVSMSQLTREDIEMVFALARTFEQSMLNGPLPPLLEGRVVATCFFQPSTRTRLSFESAALRLGGAVMGFADARVTRAGDYYRETLEDVVANVSQLADVVVLRHFESGAAERAAASSAVPVINAGDGYNQHPTQALGDIYTMQRECGDLDGLRIGFVGDLHVRSLRSICAGLSRFRVSRISFVLPEGGLDGAVTRGLDAAGIVWDVRDSVDVLLDEVDVIETIGVNHPNHNVSHDDGGRPDSPSPDRFRITADKLAQARSAPVVLHPGPRTDEISTDVDGTQHARYFAQVRYGMLVRMALLALMTPRNEATT